MDEESFVENMVQPQDDKDKTEKNDQQQNAQEDEQLTDDQPISVETHDQSTNQLTIADVNSEQPISMQECSCVPDTSNELFSSLGADLQSPLNISTNNKDSGFLSNLSTTECHPTSFSDNELPFTDEVRENIVNKIVSNILHEKETTEPLLQQICSVDSHAFNTGLALRHTSRRTKPLFPDITTDSEVCGHLLNNEDETSVLCSDTSISEHEMHRNIDINVDVIKSTVVEECVVMQSDLEEIYLSEKENISEEMEESIKTDKNTFKISTCNINSVQNDNEIFLPCYLTKTADMYENESVEESENKVDFYSVPIDDREIVEINNINSQTLFCDDTIKEASHTNCLIKKLELPNHAAELTSFDINEMQQMTQISTFPKIQDILNNTSISNKSLLVQALNLSPVKLVVKSNIERQCASLKYLDLHHDYKITNEGNYEKESEKHKIAAEENKSVTIHRRGRKIPRITADRKQSSSNPYHKKYCLRLQRKVIDLNSKSEVAISSAEHCTTNRYFLRSVSNTAKQSPNKSDSATSKNSKVPVRVMPAKLPLTPSKRKFTHCKRKSPIDNKKNFQNVVSPIAKYLIEHPAPPLIQTVHPKKELKSERQPLTENNKKETDNSNKENTSDFYPALPMVWYSCNVQNFSAMKRRELDQITKMHTIENSKNKMQYFPSVYKPTVTRHQGSSKALHWAENLTTDESLKSSPSKPSSVKKTILVKHNTTTEPIFYSNICENTTDDTVSEEVSVCYSNSLDPKL